MKSSNNPTGYQEHIHFFEEDEMTMVTWFDEIKDQWIAESGQLKDDGEFIPQFVALGDSEKEAMFNCQSNIYSYKLD